MRLSTSHLPAILCVALAGSVLAFDSATANDDGPGTVEKKRTEVQSRVDQLIQQLGAPNYATRERAHSELARLGHVAFDALYQAQEHEDVEIAQRAQYLLRSLRIDLAGEDDPPTVQGIMQNYGRLNEADRKSRMDQLAGLDHGLGIEALCRIVRFEMVLRMSKEAAVRLMRQPAPKDPVTRNMLAKKIRAAISFSQRTSAKWLLTYAKTLEDPASTIDEWERLVKAEHEAYSLFPDHSRREIVRDLLQFQADLLVELGRQAEASAAMLRWVEFGESSRMELLEAMHWLVRREAWTVVNDLITRHADVFDHDAELLYLAADAYLKQGQRQQADDAASRAAGLAPEDFKEHVRVASVLRDRGLMDWAQREYQQVVDRAPTDSAASIQAHLYISEMLHDNGQDREAGEVLKRFVDNIKKEPGLAQQMKNLRDPGEITSRMHFFFASHHHNQGNREKEIEHLKEAIALDPTNADVLISMYRVPEPDEAWRASTRQRIVAAGEQMLQQVVRFRQHLRRLESEGDTSNLKLVREYLSSRCNEYAWLVGNTEGDLDEAVRLSLESLELRPNYGGFLDTLAHCYFTKGDYAAAVKQQRKAVELEPYSGQIAQALEKFEAALEKSRKKD
jgi:tetratricopeptide (TPR) repeat protein